MSSRVPVYPTPQGTALSSRPMNGGGSSHAGLINESTMRTPTGPQKFLRFMDFVPELYSASIYRSI